MKKLMMLLTQYKNPQIKLHAKLEKIFSMKKLAKGG